MLNLIGEKYGRLLVLQEVERSKSNCRRFLCQCDCGNQKIVYMSDLRSGKTVSCGCYGKEKRLEGLKKSLELNPIDIKRGNDLTNQQFTYLTVLELDKEATLKHRSSTNKKLYWKCQCKCGNIVSVESTSLTSGNTKSCGCLQKEKASQSMKEIQMIQAKQKRSNLANQKFGLLTALNVNEEITKKYKKVYWNCICDCGKTAIVEANLLKTNQTNSCGCLGKSKGQYIIKNILEKNNIPFNTEVKFEDLKDKTYLRFDFAILDIFGNIKTLIEFDGRQHTDKTSMWYSETGVLHDKMKNEYCKIHHIPLIRIPYTHINNIELKDLLLETSKFIIN